MTLDDEPIFDQPQGEESPAPAPETGIGGDEDDAGASDIDQQQPDSNSLDDNSQQQQFDPSGIEAEVENLKARMTDLLLQVEILKTQMTDPATGVKEDIEDVRNSMFELQGVVDSIPQTQLETIGLDFGHRVIFGKRNDDGTASEWTTSGGSLVAFADGIDSVTLNTDDDLVYWLAVPDRGNTYTYVGPFGQKGDPGSDANVFVAKITSHSGSAPQWTYGFTEQSKDPTTSSGASAGYGGWKDKTSGRTGTMRNMIEDPNGSTPYGNGTDPANYVGTFNIQPATTGDIVLVWQEVTARDGDGNPTAYEYWFQYENGVDGGCS